MIKKLGILVFFVFISEQKRPSYMGGLHFKKLFFSKDPNEPLQPTRTTKILKMMRVTHGFSVSRFVEQKDFVSWGDRFKDPLETYASLQR